MNAVPVVITAAVVLIGATALLWLGRRLSDRYTSARNPYVAFSLRYQPVSLLIALVALGLVRLLVPGHASYLSWGDLSAPATGLGVLGVAEGDSWLSVGLTFLVIMTVVTGTVIWFQVGRGKAITVSALAKAVPIAVGLSAMNALTEELLFRVCMAEGMVPFLPVGVVAAASAAVFGLPHWFGHPGRLPGVLLAGFMGWFLMLSVLQTGGLGWAWLIHLAQDVVIITVLTAASSARAAGAPRVGEQSVVA